MLEEVVVTARRRDESLADTTYSVFAISGEQFEKFDSSNFDNVAESTPGLIITDTPVGAPSIVIRGVGSVATLNPFDLTVGLAIDGVYFGNSHWFQAGLFDVAQIEVLRGPQGVDFGKNTTAGLINVRSKGPGSELEAGVKLNYEAETKEEVLQVGVGGPVSDTLGFRLAVQSRQNTGYQTTIFGDDAPKLERLLARGTLQWGVTDYLTVKYTIFGSDFEKRHLGSELIECNSEYQGFIATLGSTDDCVADDLLYGGELGDGLAKKRSAHGGTGQKGEMRSHALNLDWDIGDLSIVATTGYQTLDIYTAQDSDFTNIQFIDSGFVEELVALAQEVRMSYPITDSIYSVFGVFYETADRDNGIDVDIRVGPNNPTIYAVLAADVGGLLDPNALTSVAGTSSALLATQTETAAIFGDLTLDLTDSLSVNFGMRYTEERKEGTMNQEVGQYGDPGSDADGGEGTLLFNGALNRTDIDNLNQNRISRHLDPSVVVKWNFYTDFPLSFLDSGQTYFSYKEGYKSGGFDLVAGVDGNGQPNSPYEFFDETVIGYEAGLKIEALDNTIRASLAAFYTAYDDLQIQFTPPNGTIINTLNAGSSLTKGVEGDLKWVINHAFSFDMSASYVIAEYDEFREAPCYPGQSEEAGCVNGTQDLSGVSLAAAPKYSGSFGLNYEQPIGRDLLFNATLQSSYTDEINFNVFGDPTGGRDEFWVSNIRLGLSDILGSWDVALMGRNILNERSLSLRGEAPLSSIVASTPSYYGNLMPPRTLAILLSLQF